MIEIKRLNFRYPDGAHALIDISVEVPSEQIFAVMGQSGSGKTTLLNCIARFLKPESGLITLNGQAIDEMDEKEFRQKIGVVFQRLNLFPHLTILENMTLAPIRVQGRPEVEATEAARAMLDRLGIAELSGSYPAQVSGGQAQRAAIARGLMLQPEYMLLDEPTSALDARTTEDFAGWLKELHEKTNFIVVTHDLLFAKSAAEHGVFMREGRVVHTGAIGEILAAGNI